MQRRKILSLVLPLVAACAVSASVPEAAARIVGDAKEYLLTDLGDLGGGPTFPAGMNDYHQIVGTAVTDAVDERGRKLEHAFLWTPKTPGGSVGSMVDLGTFGGIESGATAINSMGQIVGHIIHGPERGTEGFLWTPDTPNGTTGTIVKFPTAEFGYLARPSDINDFGQVVGQVNVQNGFLFTPDEPNGTTGTSTFFDLMYIGGINDSGQFTGKDLGVHKACVFNPVKEHSNEGTFEFLSSLPSGEGTPEATDINSFGYVCGTVNLPNRYEGFIARGNQHTLIGAAGDASSYLRALNNADPPSVVGTATSARQAGPRSGRAIRVRGNQRFDLTDMVRQPLFRPVQLYTAIDIGADDSIAVWWSTTDGVVVRAGLITKLPASGLAISLDAKDEDTFVGKSKFGFQVTNTSNQRRLMKVALGLDQATDTAQFEPPSAYKGPGRARMGAGGVLEISNIPANPGQTVAGEHLIRASVTGQSRITARVQSTDASKPLAADAQPLTITVGERIPEDVTDELSAEVGPLRVAGRTVTQKVTLTNRGRANTIAARTITGPLYLVADRLTGGVLVNADGVTKVLEPLNSPYIKIDRPNLKPNQKFSVTVKFKRPAGSKEAIQYARRVLAGKGTP